MADCDTADRTKMAKTKECGQVWSYQQSGESADNVICCRNRLIPDKVTTKRDKNYEISNFYKCDLSARSSSIIVSLSVEHQSSGVDGRCGRKYYIIISKEDSGCNMIYIQVLYKFTAMQKEVNL